VRLPDGRRLYAAPLGNAHREGGPHFTCSHRSKPSIFFTDGKEPPFGPDAKTNPVNDYGAQKVEAEAEILKNSGNMAILRIPLQYGKNFGLNPSSR